MNIYCGDLRILKSKDLALLNKVCHAHCMSTQHLVSDRDVFNRRFTTFFEQSTLPMEIYSLSGEPVAVNTAWEELFQTTREELVGYNVLQDPHVKKTPLWKFLQRAYAGESVEVPAFLYDPTQLNKSGRARWIEAWISPVKDDLGNVREIAMILKDVTEKIVTQQALIQSISHRKSTEEKFQILSERLSMAVKAGQIGIWEWIPGTNNIYMDETTKQILDFEEQEFRQTMDCINSRIHPDDCGLFWVNINKAIQERKSYSFDHRVIKKDGSVRWIQGSGMALYDEQGHAYHMMGTVLDITERKEAEADQKFLSKASDFITGSLDHREILKSLCEHAINYFCDGCFIDLLESDGSLKRLMVIHPDAEVIKKIMDLESNFPSHNEGNPIYDVLVGGKTILIQDVDVLLQKMRYYHGDEYFEAANVLEGKSSIHVRMKGRESILGVMNFFTLKGSPKNLNKRHIWLAEELAYRASMAYENVLIHQASLEAIKARDEFLSIASHELKTPLQSLTLQNQMRRRNLDKNLLSAFAPEKLPHMIDADLRHLMRITRLIDDMLDISRIRAGKLTFMKEDVELKSFVIDVLDRFRPQLDAVGCQLQVKLPEEIKVVVDIYRIEQVLVNVLTNAIKYGAGKPIRVEVLKRNERALIHVHDQGLGIKEEDMERIFQRFERAISSSEVSGLGLGLYISRQIMEQHDGSLYASSLPGKGSIFTMELPSHHD